MVRRSDEAKRLFHCKAVDSAIRQGHMAQAQSLIALVPPSIPTGIDTDCLSLHLTLCFLQVSDDPVAHGAAVRYWCQAPAWAAIWSVHEGGGVNQPTEVIAVRSAA